MKLIFLSTVWVLIVQPNEGAQPNASKLRGEYARQFFAENVEFVNQDDCEVYAKKHLDKMLSWRREKGKQLVFPPDVVPTYTCASENR